LKNITHNGMIYMKAFVDEDWILGGYSWIPAFAGMTMSGRNDDEGAGMTMSGRNDDEGAGMTMRSVNDDEGQE